MKDFFEFLRGRGYIVGKLWHDGVGFAPFDYTLDNLESGPNFVAIGDDGVEIRRALSRRRGRSGYHDPLASNTSG